jgi:hypothetical protein
MQRTIIFRQNPVEKAKNKAKFKSNQPYFIYFGPQPQLAGFLARAPDLFLVISFFMSQPLQSPQGELSFLRIFFTTA